MSNCRCLYEVTGLASMSSQCTVPPKHFLLINLMSEHVAGFRHCTSSPDTAGKLVDIAGRSIVVRIDGRSSWLLHDQYSKITTIKII